MRAISAQKNAAIVAGCRFHGADEFIVTLHLGQMRRRNQMTSYHPHSPFQLHYISSEILKTLQHSRVVFIKRLRGLKDGLAQLPPTIFESPDALSVLFINPLHFIFPRLNPFLVGALDDFDYDVDDSPHRGEERQNNHPPPAYCSGLVWKRKRRLDIGHIRGASFASSLEVSAVIGRLIEVVLEIFGILSSMKVLEVKHPLAFFSARATEGFYVTDISAQYFPLGIKDCGARAPAEKPMNDACPLYSSADADS